MAPSSPPNNTSSPPADKGKDVSASQPANNPPAATADPDSAQAHEQSPASSTEADKDGRTTLSNSTFVNPDDKDKSVDKHSDTQPSTIRADDNASADASRSKSTKKQKLAKAAAATDAAASASRNSASKSKTQPTQPSTAGAAKDKQANGQQRGQRTGAKKPSFVARLMSKLIPCTGPSKAHTIDLPETEKAAAQSKEETPAKSTAPVSPPSAPAEKEKQVATTPAAAAAGTGMISADAAAEAIVGGTNEESKEVNEKEKEKPTVPPLETRPSSESQHNKRDSEILIPPTPTKSLLPVDETGGATSGAVQPPGSTGTDLSSPTPQANPSTPGDASATESEETTTDDEGHEEEQSTEDGEHIEEDDEEALIMSGGAGIPIGPDGVPRPLLPPIAPQHVGRKCLVLDLDETLVHSSFKSLQNADYVVPVEIEYHWHNVYVIKRPGVDNFLKKMGEIYEIVVFTASLSKYADPVLDRLDIHRVVSHRLFRESCYNHRGNYVKDLSQLGRPIADTIILDNSPASYIFHPNNAVPVSSWFNDPHDTELTDLCPFLADLGDVPDVRGVLDGGL